MNLIKMARATACACAIAIAVGLYLSISSLTPSPEKFAPEELLPSHRRRLRSFQFPELLDPQTVSIKTTPQVMADLDLADPKSVPESCWRSCPERRNLIYSNFPMQGLNDREFIIQNLAQLAGYLCDRLVIPPPIVLLHPAHNHDNYVDKDVKWSDFFNVTFEDDGSQVLVDDSFSNRWRQDLSCGPHCNAQKDFNEWGNIPVFNEDTIPGFSNFFHVVTDKKDSIGGVVQTFKTINELEGLTRQQDGAPFLWEIHSPYFRTDLFRADLLTDLAQDITKPDSPDSMLPYISRNQYPGPDDITSGCVYAKIGMPAIMAELLGRLVARVNGGGQDSIVGSLHIRRGDYGMLDLVCTRI